MTKQNKGRKFFPLRIPKGKEAEFQQRATKHEEPRMPVGKNAFGTHYAGDRVPKNKWAPKSMSEFIDLIRVIHDPACKVVTHASLAERAPLVRPTRRRHHMVSAV